MLDFRPVTLDDAPLLRRLLSGEGRICDSTAGTVLMWRRYFDTRIAFAGETAVLRASYRGRNVFTRPFGPDPDCAVGAIIDFARENSLPAEFGFLDEESAKHLAERFGAAVTQDADGADFLYPAENFIAYAGKHLREKRNHLYQFRREYPDAVFEPIGDANIHEVMTFFDSYCAENESDEALAATENDICREVLENRGSYGFLSLALRIDGGIRAFTAGEVAGDTLFVHIEKADRNTRGAYQAIASEFVKSVPGISFVNREDDSGDPGLRKSKMSYRPCALLGKYTAVIR